MPKRYKRTRKLSTRKLFKNTIKKKNNRQYIFDTSKIHPASIIL